MKSKFLNKKFLVLILFVVPFIAKAQVGTNPLSVRSDQKSIYGQPIYEADVMYRTTVWRKINLREKQNLPFNATERDIITAILEGVKKENGGLQPYRINMSATSSGVDEADAMTKDNFFNEAIMYTDPDDDEDKPYRPEDMYMLEIKEDLVFDRRRSRMYWDIISLTITAPASMQDQTNPGYERVATFKWKDLYRYFKDSYDESQKKGVFEDLRCFWYNPSNPRRHMSLADAFEMRLFSSRIFKILNPQDKEVEEIITQEYGVDLKNPARKVLEACQKIEYDLMEYEHNLWEF